MSGKQRIDLLLVEKGFCPSREKARKSIMAGLVKVDGKRVDKPGTDVPVDSLLEVLGPAIPYVSRGGLKLEKAMEEFGIRVEGMVAADVGASTGGFTDCLLQNGAKKVYAIDVGYGQLDWKLRQDPRVVSMERTNIRYLDSGTLTEVPEFITIDVSFISLEKVLPKITEILAPEGKIVALIKPQFEAGREQVGKKGVVRDPVVHEQVIKKVLENALKLGFSLLGLTYSPVTGPEGNIEYLAYLHRITDQRKTKTSPGSLQEPDDMAGEARQVVIRAFENFLGK